MNIDRVCEIFESEDKIEVLHNGSPVWIQSVDMKNGYVSIHEQNNPAETMIVPAEELIESQ